MGNACSCGGFAEKEKKEIELISDNKFIIKKQTATVVPEISVVKEKVSFY